MNDARKEELIIYVDNGGTFTDAVIVREDGSYIRGKSSTTPNDLSTCFFNSIEAAAENLNLSLREVVSQARLIGFGTTAGTNAVISMDWPKVGMITTRGFEDTCSIMRLGRWVGLPRLVGLHIAGSDKPDPIVPRWLTKGITERIDSLGHVFIPLNEEEVKTAIRELVDEEVEGIVVALLWSFLNSTHEYRVKEIISEVYPEMPVTLSCEVAPAIREYARFNSAIVDLCIAKPVRKLFAQVKGQLKDIGYDRELLVMQGAGGLSSSEVIHPVNTLNSGPVGGILGVDYWKKVYSEDNAVSTDMGGTSFDVGLIPKEGAAHILEPLVGRYMVSIPMLDLTVLGAGGGTIAYIHEVRGRLEVGPRSAGADPGPVCYDRGGTEPTVTDADIVMNRINPDYFLGGKIKLNRDKAVSAIKEKIADPLGMRVEEAAQAICNIIDETMGAMLRVKLNEHGFSTEDFTLFAFGGAGGLHCAGFTKTNRFKKVIIPPTASTFCAFGASTGDILHRFTASPFIVIPELPYDPVTQRFKITSLDKVPKEGIERFNQMFEMLEQRANELMAREGVSEEKVQYKYEIQMRYGSQLYEINFVSPVNRIRGAKDLQAIVEAFEKEYEKLYGKRAMYARGGIELINISLEVTAPPVVKPTVLRQEFVCKESREALLEERDVYFEDKFVRTAVYRMEAMRCGNLIKGPALIEGRDTNIAVPPDRYVEVDEYLNMIMYYA